MKNFLQLKVLILVTINIMSCQSNSKVDGRLDEWYSKVKDEIVESGMQKTDSISYEQKEETLFITYFSKGYKIRQEYRSTDTTKLLFTAAYGKNNHFELRSEMHKNGQKATEGITYKGNYYGPWSVWYDNGQIMHKGNLYENHHFGTWTYYKENGEVEKLIENHRLDLIDSILDNENLHTTLGFHSLVQKK